MSPRPPTDEERRWEAWLFAPHSREELARWVPTLEVFRYWRAVGGHSGMDADELVAAFRVPTRAELERVLGALGARVTLVDADAPRPVPGQSYTGPEWAAFPKPIPGLEGLEQPSHLDVPGVRSHAWVHGGRLELTVSDPDRLWEVTETSVTSAQRVEPLLADVLDLVVDPPRTGPHCVCPQRYPELWA